MWLSMSKVGTHHPPLAPSPEITPPMSSSPPASPYHDMSSAPAARPASEDPFYVVKGKVQAQVRQLRGDYERWKALLETSDTSTPGGEFAELHQSLKVNLKKAKFDITDLARTVEIVEANRAKFAIDDDELASRRRFVNDTKATLQGIKDARGSDRTKRKMASDREKRAAGGGTAFERASAGRSADYVASRQQQHQALVERQDVVLDDMSSALARLGDVANTLETELDSQNAMLEEFDSELDDTQNMLDNVTAKIEKILGTKSRWKICTIIFLFALMILLFFLVVYA